MKVSFVHNLNPSCCHLSPLFSPWAHKVTRQSHTQQPPETLPVSTTAQQSLPWSGWNWRGHSSEGSRSRSRKLPFLSLKKHSMTMAPTKLANMSQELIAWLWRNDSFRHLTPSLRKRPVLWSGGGKGLCPPCNLVTETRMTPGGSLSFLPCRFFLTFPPVCVSTFTHTTVVNHCLFYA